jgi:hypothetical protein
VKQIALLLPLVLLAACGQQAEDAPAAAKTVAAAAPAPVSKLPAPTQQTFAAAFGDACKGAKPVKTAVCKRAGLGSKDVVCEFGLGDDEYLRNRATLTANEDNTGWVLADPATVCAATGA